MSSLVTRNQRGCLVPVEREGPPPEEVPLPIAATDAERAADELSLDNGELTRSFVGVVRKMVNTQGWDPTAAQKRELVDVMMHIVSHTRHDRVAIQAARVVVDCVKQDQDLARIQLCAQAQLDQQGQQDQASNLFETLLSGATSPACEEDLAAFQKMLAEPDGEAEGGG